VNRKTPPLALTAFAALALFPIVVVALHFAQFGQIHPLTQAVSELALGRGGWLMAVAFCSSGAGMALLALVLRRSTARPRLAPVLLTLAGALSFVSACFHADPSTASTTSGHGQVHQLAGVATFILLIAAMFALVGAFRRDPAWRPIARSTRDWAIASVPAFLLIPIAADAWFGLAQRLFLAVVISRFLVLALHAYRVEPAAAGTRPAATSATSVTATT
jgi:hypothetical protein